MKTKSLPFLCVATVSLAAFSLTGCSDKTQTTEGVLPPAPAATASATTPALPPGEVHFAAALNPGIAAAQWSDIKDCSFELRTKFSDGLKHLEAKVESQNSELLARRAAMTSSTDNKAWDTAMKEMSAAQADLKSTAEAAGNATSDTWNQAKDKIDHAWARTQDAYAKVKASAIS